MAKGGSLRFDEDWYREQVAKNERWHKDFARIDTERDAPRAVIAPAPNKYHAEKTGGYASKKEASRAQVLRLMEQAGEISELEEQVSFIVIPTQRDAQGRLLEKCARYIADFVYRDKTGAKVVEDCKGVLTPQYILKRKLMLMVHGIRVKEI